MWINRFARTLDVSAQEEVGPNFALAHKAVVLLDAENEVVDPGLADQLLIVYIEWDAGLYRRREAECVNVCFCDRSQESRGGC